MKIGKRTKDWGLEHSNIKGWEEHGEIAKETEKEQLTRLEKPRQWGAGV